MTTVSQWIGGMKSVVDNGRNHALVIDLPEDQGGNNYGATALELALMGLAGCISTIFAVIAKNSELVFDELKVVVKAEKGQKTIEKADITVHLKAENQEKAQRILEKTIAVCPVGVLFENAGVEMNTELIFMQ